MKEIIVQSGFGYFRDKLGNITTKAELPAGAHQVPDDIEYIEVAGPADLAAIQVYEDPVRKAKFEVEDKIRKRLRKIAVDQLKTEGQIPPDYE